MSTSLPSTNTSNQQSYFDNYYKSQNRISGNHYDAVYTFFLARTNNNKDAAKSLASSLLEVTYQNGIDPMLVLDDFKKYNNSENLKIAMISLFNNTRRNTSKIGVAADVTPAPRYSRNIRS